MKNFKYLLVAVFLFIGSIIMVNAIELLPYEENIESVTLITYHGERNEYWTRKWISNKTRIHQVLDVIDDKIEQEAGGIGGANLTTLEFKYYDDSKVTITFYNDNLVYITEPNGESKLYEINYEGSAEDKIIDLFSDIIVGNNNGDVSNPETSDNITTILIISLAVLGITVISYRKRKLS